MVIVVAGGTIVMLDGGPDGSTKGVTVEEVETVLQDVDRGESDIMGLDEVDDPEVVLATGLACATQVT